MNAINQYGYLPSNDLQKVGRGVEWVLLLAGMFLFSGSLMGPLFLSEQTASAEGSPMLRMAFYPVYLLTLLLVFLRPWSTLNAVARSGLLLLPVLLALFSQAWSIDPDASQRRAIALALTTLFAIYVASRYDWRDFIELFATTFLLVALLSLFTAIFKPSVGIMHEIHPGAWAGVFWEKNSFGMNMAKAAHLSLCAAIFVPKRRLFWLGAFGLCMMLVLLSTSKTSLMAVMLASGGMLALYLIRQGPRVAIPLVYFGVVFAVAIVLGIEFFPKFVFGLIGKDPTLTGRTDIWEALVAQIRHRPWLGYGYGVFWLHEDGPAYWVRQITQWEVPTAHNGWLETWLGIGLVGVVSFALAYASALIAALRMLLKGQAAYWALISTLVFLLFSMSESNILQQNNLGWILFAATAAKLFGARPLGYGSKRRRTIETGFHSLEPENLSQPLGSPVGYFGPALGLDQPQWQGQEAVNKSLYQPYAHPEGHGGNPPVLPGGLGRSLPEGEGFGQAEFQGRPVRRNFLENQRPRGPGKHGTFRHHP